MTWIKICGTTSLEDALASVAAGADALGFVFARSPRRIAPDCARAMVAHVPAGLEKVGVFVNETAEHIREVAAYAGLTAIQLHGDESVEFARNLRETTAQVAGRRLRIFKALPVAPGLEGLLRNFGNNKVVDGVLLDSAPGSAESARGGRGQGFDWNRAAILLRGWADHVRLIVAGGLSPENVGDALQALHPWGVDVCTGVECEPGKKHHRKLREFVAAVRAAGARG